MHSFNKRENTVLLYLQKPPLSHLNEHPNLKTKVDAVAANTSTGSTAAQNLLELAGNSTIKESFVFPIVGASSNRIGNTMSDIDNNQLENSIKNKYQLSNYPNPFNESTTITAILPENITTSYLVIRDVAGREMYRKKLTQKINQYSIDNNILQEGIYLYYIENNGAVILTQKLIKIK